MATSSLEILVRLRDEATKELGKITGALESHKKQLRIAGGAATAFGGAVIGGLVMATKSAAEEEQGVIRLSQALGNIGVSYDEVGASLEATIASTQKLTAVGDGEQREAIAALVAITGDYEKSLSLLPLALDLAAAKGMDLSSASELVGRVSEGNLGILSRYGIVLEEGAGATEALGAIQTKFAGQAEAFGASTAGQMALVQANFGDLAETLGTTFLPVMREIAEVLAGVTGWFNELDPSAQKWVGIALAVLGGLAAIGGPIAIMLTMLPLLTAGIGALGVAINLAMGPAGLITLAIIALIAAAILIWQNWDTIKEKIIAIWEAIWGFLTGIWDKITGIFSEHWDKILAILFPAVGLPILIIRNWGKITEFVGEIWEKIKGLFSEHWDKILAILFPVVGLPLLIFRNWSKITEFVGEIFDTVKEFVGERLDAVVDLVWGLVGQLNRAGQSILDVITAPWRAAYNFVIDIINRIIGAFNTISVKIPSYVPIIGGKEFSINIPLIPNIPAPSAILAEGGIVTRPTLAMLGERGPEAVIPLGRGTGGITINIIGSVYGIPDLERIIKRTVREAVRAGGFDGLGLVRA